MVALLNKSCCLDPRRWSGGSITIQILLFGSETVVWWWHYYTNPVVWIRDGGLVVALLYKSCCLDLRRWSGGSTTIQILLFGSETVVWW